MTARNKFLCFLIKECSGLNYAVLNYVYNDIKELPTEEPMEILIDKLDYSALLYIISSGKEISWITTKKSLASQIIDIKFNDNTNITLKIKSDIKRNGIILMNAEKVLRLAVINKGNIKTPAPHHLFEYILLDSVLHKKNIDEKYRLYFTSFNFEVRSKIFAHLRSKYNFVIHLLDDLYVLKKSNYQKVIHKVWAEKQNRGWRYAFHKMNFVSAYIATFLLNMWSLISTRRIQQQSDPALSHQLRTFWHKNTAVRNI